MNTETTPPWSWSHVQEGDARQFSPSADRNQGPIIEAMSSLVAAIAKGGRVLELASGTGQHAVAFASAFPAIVWQPSDFDPRSLASISAHRAAAALGNLEPPVRADLMDSDWAAGVGGPFDLVFASNVLHVAPFAVTMNLLEGAARLLRQDGVLAVYGPMRRQGDWVSDGNRSFDLDLRKTNPEWGIRDTADIKTQAAKHGIALDTVIAMPANNSMLVLRRSGAHSASSS